MNNVVIITFIDSYNYGAFLQAKATEVLVSQMGYQARFMNYCNREEENQRKLIAFSSHYSLGFNVKRVIYKLWYGYYHGEIINGRKNFQKLIDDLPKTEKIHCVEDIEKAEKIDILICGSDQIWNPEICNHKIDPIYYGGFSNVEKRISFASSFGSYVPQETELALLRSYFCDFQAISVREKFAQNIIDSFGIEKNVEIVLDPTLCMSPEAWKKIVINEKRNVRIEGDYAVLYFVNSKIECQPLIDYIKKKLKLKTIWIKNNNLKRLNVDMIVNNASPYDFVDLIASAKFVLTDSFHGTAFSINFNIDFASVINSSNPERSRHLCKELKLENRMMSESDAFCNTEKIDYSYANTKLDKLRKHSVEWLRSAMKV